MLEVTITAPDRRATADLASDDAAVVDLPRLPVNGRISRSEIDRRAAGVAEAAREGAVSEAHARRVVAALLYGSCIPESVAARGMGERQHREDVADRLRLLLFTKVMQESAGGFRLDRVATGVSACGWATQLCRAALPSAARDVRLRQREILHPPVGDDMADGPVGRTIVEVADLVRSPSQGVPFWTEGAADAGLVVVVAGMRTGSRRHRGAAHLGRTLGVPPPARPADPTVCRRIAGVLERDPQAARRSVRAELARRHGFTPARIDDAADPLAALWTEYPVGALQRLADRDPRFAHVVAAGAVARRPRSAPTWRPPCRRTSAARSRTTRRGATWRLRWSQRSWRTTVTCPASSRHPTAPHPRSPRAGRPERQRLSPSSPGGRPCFRTAPLGGVPAMVEAELHDRLMLIEMVVADLRHRPAA